MGYKIKSALKKSKWIFIIGIAIWIALSILLSAPIGKSIIDTKQIEGATSDTFFDTLFKNWKELGATFGKAFGPQYFGTFMKVELYVTIAMIFIIIVGIVKSMPKNEYSGIENGSSDWASGEQYSVLSKKQGILLAENHYLPVDKRGNVNVLVVGRIRFSENLLHMLFQMLINFWVLMYLQIQRENYMIKQQVT